MLRRTVLWILASGGALPYLIRAARADPRSAAIAAGEPPLAEILKRLGYTIDTDHDEIEAQLFVRARPGPVTHQPIAAYGLPNRCSSGWYRPTDGLPRPESLWVIDANHNKQDLPPLMRGGTTQFDPGDMPFGLWVSSAGFKNETVYTQDALQRFIPRFQPNDRHKAHVLPVKKSGKEVPKQYVIGWEYSTNNDDQDIVTLLTNVQPAPATRSP
jgi:hypothetical protein